MVNTMDFLQEYDPFIVEHFYIIYLMFNVHNIYFHVNLHWFIKSFYGNILFYWNVIISKYFHYSFSYIISIFLLAFKLYIPNCSYSVCSMFSGFYKIMQKQFIHISMLLLRWSLILFLVPGQWCFPILINLYYIYNEHLCTKFSLFENVS